MPVNMARRLAAEALGTALLLAAVVGSGVMAERLSGGNAGVALLANALATGAALVVLITIFAPLSGAHFNPCVSLFFALRREMSWHDAARYVPVQIAAAIATTNAAPISHESAPYLSSGKISPRLLR